MRSRGTFKKGDPRAAAAGRASKKPPKELKEARQLRANEFEGIIYQYFDLPLQEVERLLHPENRKKLPVKEAVVLKLIQTTLKTGNVPSLSFLLDRSIGKVQEERNVNVNVRSLHAQLVDEIENEEREAIDVTPTKD